MAHYCSKHTSYWKFRDHLKSRPWCNVCLEKDHARYEATRTARAAALADTPRCSISLNDLCSELAAQKEKEHLMHLTVFNSYNPVDIHLSNRSLIPQPKMATNKPSQRPIPLRRSSGGSLDITACITCFWCTTTVTKRPYRFLNQKLQAGLSGHAETLMLPFPRVWAVPE